MWEDESQLQKTKLMSHCSVSLQCTGKEINSKLALPPCPFRHPLYLWLSLSLLCPPYAVLGFRVKWGKGQNVLHWGRMGWPQVVAFTQKGRNTGRVGRDEQQALEQHLTMSLARGALVHFLLYPLPRCQLIRQPSVYTSLPSPVATQSCEVQGHEECPRNDNRLACHSAHRQNGLHCC
jgi:hypothetical protein